MAPIKYIVDAECCRPHGIQCNWIVPDGVRHVTFEIWGGGGGGAAGGGVSQCDCCSSGSPGMGGAYARKSINVEAGDMYMICSGSGGMDTLDPDSGGPVAACCEGKAGGTSSVIGAGLTNFCAEGGAGGRAEWNIVCYGHCGCMWYQANNETCGQQSPVNNATGTSATAYGYDYHSQSLNGASWIYADGGNAYTVEYVAGSGAGPYGGGGGWNFGGKYNCWGGISCDGLPFAIRPAEEWHGRIPGGGGVSFQWMSMCECWGGRSGKGAPGMVKITY